MTGERMETDPRGRRPPFRVVCEFQGSHMQSLESFECVCVCRHARVLVWGCRGARVVGSGDGVCPELSSGERRFRLIPLSGCLADFTYTLHPSRNIR